MATRVDYVNSIKNADMDTIYLTGAGYVNYPFKGISRESALGWNEPVWGSELNRGLNLVMDNIDTVEYGMVARCEVSFKYMNIEDYKVLCKISKQRVCYANFFDRETGQRVSQEMAFTGNEIAKLYKFNTDYLGVLDASIKLVATNRDRVSEISATHTISYNANGGSGSISPDSVKWAGQLQLPSSGFTKTGSTLLGFNTSAGGFGEQYELGQKVTIFGNLTLYAQWSDSATLKVGSTLNGLMRNGQYSDNTTEVIYFDYYTGQDEYFIEGKNQIQGITSFAYADVDNKIKMYRSSDNKKLFVLANKNCTIYANQDSQSLFSEFKKLTTLNINNLNFQNATNMYDFFGNCNKLTSINRKYLNTDSVTNMSYMFLGCSSLTQIPRFNTSNVLDMSYMFLGCDDLEVLDLRFMNTENVITMMEMFNECFNLKTINLTSFKTNSVTDMYGMFASCTNLTKLDLSSFNKGAGVDIGFMFAECPKLKTIYVDSLKWITPSYDGFFTFKNCTSIVGGNGTAYDSTKIGAKYARVDVPGTPGYLTEA